MMALRLIGTELVDGWRARGARLESGDDATLASPDDTNSFGLLVRRAVRMLRPQVALDIGCGCGIPTLEAVAAGATRIIGVDVVQANVTLTRSNATRAGFGDRVSARLIEWGRWKPGPERIDLVVANPPYLPDAPGVAVDGGPDGTRVLRSIIANVPESTSGLALLFGSLSSPRKVMTALSDAGWRVRSMLAHCVRFGRYTSEPATLATLHRLRRAGAAFFYDVMAETPKFAGHSYLVLGVVATRGTAPKGLLESVETLVHAFGRFGPRALDLVRMPVSLDAASYFDPDAATVHRIDA